MKEYKYKINGKEYKVAVGDIKDNIAHVEVNGRAYAVEMEEEKKPEVIVKRPAAPAPKQASAPKSAPKAAGGSAGGVKSPLPGVILDIKVSIGQEVKKGDVVIVLEAMKMENNINADRDGKIVEIPVSKGESVLEGTDLVIIG